MTTPTIEDLARLICETRNVPGFKCTCPLAGEPKGNDWCNHNRAVWQARAVLDALQPVVAEAFDEGMDAEPCVHGANATTLFQAQNYAARIIAQLKGESRE